LTEAQERALRGRKYNAEVRKHGAPDGNANAAKQRHQPDDIVSQGRALRGRKYNAEGRKHGGTGANQFKQSHQPDDSALQDRALRGRKYCAAARQNGGDRRVQFISVDELNPGPSRGTSTLLAKELGVSTSTIEHVATSPKPRTAL